MSLRPSHRSLARLSSALIASLSVCRPAWCEDTPLPMPHGQFPPLYYPSDARRLNKQGRLVVEFSIDGTGHTVDLRIAKSEAAAIFDRVALDAVRKARFKVPTDWEVSDAAGRKFSASFTFLLRPCDPKAPCEELEPFAADKTIVLKGASLFRPRR